MKRTKADRVRLLGNFIDETTRTHSQQLSPVKVPVLNNIVRTTLYEPAWCCFLETAQHSFYPYDDDEVRFNVLRYRADTLSVRIQVMPFLQPTTRSNNTQTQLPLPPRRRPTPQSRAACRLLRLSRDKLCPLDLSRLFHLCLLYTSPSPRDAMASRMPSSA